MLANTTDGFLCSISSGERYHDFLVRRAVQPQARPRSELVESLFYISCYCPLASMVSTTSSTTEQRFETLLLDSQTEPFLDHAMWKEMEESEHGCSYIINSPIPAARDRV